MTKATNYQNTIKTIDHKEELQIEYDQAKDLESNLRSRINSLQSKLREAKSAVRGWEAGYKRTNYPADKQTLDAAIETQTRIQTELDQESLKLANTEAEQAKINKELLSLKLPINESLIIEHQNTIEGVTQHINRFNDLIEAQQQIIADCSHVDNGISELKQTRQDILTNIALGDDQAAELQAIDKKIESCCKQDDKTKTSNEKSINDAQSTIAGLTSRKDKALSDLSTLENRTPALLGQFIKDMAFVELEKYKKAATTITGIIEKINHLDKLISQCGDDDSTGVLNVDRWNMKLPLFQGMTAIDGTQDTERFFVDINNQTIFDDAGLEELKAAIKSQGIELG